MSAFIQFGRGNTVFKSESKSEPFPPAYYENKKRATELITRMTTPKNTAKRT